jgi:excisionase family DNA binding protein
LGIGCSKTVVRWIERGWLYGKRGQRVGPHRRWLVWEDRLLEFLEDEAHWHRWRPERITEPCLREWASELRAGVRFLRLTEVAERYYVTSRTVENWIREGRIPAVCNGNHLVRESDLAGFVPPGQRSRHGLQLRAWTTDDDAVLREMRSSGAAYAVIAQRLGRSISSVANRWHRMRGVA